MQNFLVGILVKLLSDPKVQQYIKDLLGQLIAERIVPLVPLAAASAAKAIGDLIPDLTPPALDHITETVRTDLNNIIPDIDFGIPVLDDLMDFWRPKNG